MRKQTYKHVINLGRPKNGQGATLGRLCMEDDIGLDDSPIMRMIELGEKRGSGCLSKQSGLTHFSHNLCLTGTCLVGARMESGAQMECQITDH